MYGHKETEEQLTMEEPLGTERTFPNQPSWPHNSPSEFLTMEGPVTHYTHTKNRLSQKNKTVLQHTYISMHNMFDKNVLNKYSIIEPTKVIIYFLWVNILVFKT